MELDLNSFSSTTVPKTDKPTLTPQEVHNDLKYLIVPLVVIVIIFLSALVYLIARRRRMEVIRQSILTLYEFDSNEQEWESQSPLLYSTDHFNYTTAF